jgi:hypothetical protein
MSKNVPMDNLWMCFQCSEPTRPGVYIVWEHGTGIRTEFVFASPNPGRIIGMTEHNWFSDRPITHYCPYRFRSSMEAVAFSVEHDLIGPHAKRHEIRRDSIFARAKRYLRNKW